jgi:hypothetical protein
MPEKFTNRLKNVPKAKAPLKTVAQLNARTERCVYDSFTQVKGVTDTAEALGALVNTAGYHADDDASLPILADHCKFTRVFGVKGDDYDSEEFRFDDGAQYIVTITMHRDAIRLIEKYAPLADQTKDPMGLFFDPALKSAEWHAIYGSTPKGRHDVAWVDPQNRFRNGPTRGSVAICFMKK